MKYYVGCSGFTGRDLKGSFYPSELKSAEWLNFYSSKFNSVEINSTFYRMPRISTLEKWYAEVPEDFVFAIKAPKTITHINKFSDSLELLTTFYDRMANGLKEKLGPILFQLPPSFYFTEENLQLIISQLDSRFQNTVEFRHASWWNAQVFEAFSLYNIIFCGISYPSKTIPLDLIQTTNAIYYRFHGVPVLYKSHYEREYLKRLAESINPNTKTVYLYFNNTWGLSGVENAKEMVEILENTF